LEPSCPLPNVDKNLIKPLHPPPVLRDNAKNITAQLSSLFNLTKGEFAIPDKDGAAYYVFFQQKKKESEPQKKLGLQALPRLRT
jgi:hypothetical protein